MIELTPDMTFESALAMNETKKLNKIVKEFLDTAIALICEDTLEEIQDVINSYSKYYSDYSGVWFIQEVVNKSILISDEKDTKIRAAFEISERQRLSNINWDLIAE